MADAAPRQWTPGPLLGALASFSVRRPRVVLAASFALAVTGLSLAGSHLELRTSNLDLVDPHLPEVAAFLDLAHAFGTPNQLVVALEGGDEATRQRAVERLLPQLAAAPGVEAVRGRLPGDPFLLARMGLDPWFRSRDGKMTFVFVEPDDPISRVDTLTPFVRGVREVLSAAALPRDGIRAGLTGMPQYALDDREVVQRDIGRLSMVSLVLVAALFVSSFGSVRRPLLAVLCLALAVSVVLGLASLWPGHLTLLSAFFASILFGLGIDFGIHLLDRVEELLASGRPLDEAVSVAAVRLGPALWTGAVTTAAGFLAAIASGFLGFAELGAIAGIGILVCLAATMTTLPALLVLAGRRAGERPSRRRLGHLLARAQHDWLALLLAVVTVASLAVARPRFDADYLDLQPRDSEAALLERRMVQTSAYSPQFAAFVVASGERADALVAALRREETVGAVHSATDLDLLAAAGASREELASWRSAFVSADGRFAVYAYPNGNIWDPAFEDRFLSRMRALDPDVTGMPALGQFMIDRTRRALWITGLLGSLALLTLVGADLRSTRWTLLAVAPTFLGVILMAGAMHVLGVPFNPLNVMALPVVIGMAVDNGVHLVHRFRTEGNVGATLVGSGRGVILTSATTLAAFGTLAFTSHRGLASFAIVLCLGVTSSLVLSLFLLPPLLRRLGSERGRTASATPPPGDTALAEPDRTL